jgi:hypothetical protein
MVASGHAIPSLLAADLTRTIVSNHNRKNSERKVGFFDTVRLMSFFLKRVAHSQNAYCKVSAVGFLQDGTPCLASIVISPEFNRAAFHPIKKGGCSAMPVGDEAASILLLEAMAQAKRENRPTIPAALSILLYTSRHEGAFGSIGGGISVGTCINNSEYFSWPIIEIDGQRFLRGMDVTAAFRQGWPAPEVVSFDETWCADLDRQISTTLNRQREPLGKLAGLILMKSRQRIFSSFIVSRTYRRLDIKNQYCPVKHFYHSDK